MEELLPELRLTELLPERRTRPLWHWYTELRDDERADSDRPWVKVPPIIERAPLALEDWTASFGRRLRLDRGQDLPPGPESYRRVPETSAGESGGMGSGTTPAAETPPAVTPGGADPPGPEADPSAPAAVVTGTRGDAQTAGAGAVPTTGVPTATPGKRRVALGVPGIWEDWRHLHVWAQALHDAGWDVHLLETLGDMTAPVPNLADLVAEHLHLQDLHDVVLFAHSKGGLVGKAALVTDLWVVGRV